MEQDLESKVIELANCCIEMANQLTQLKERVKKLEQPSPSVSGPLPISEIELFVQKHETLIGNAILKNDEDLQKRIGTMARNELGYSKNTWSLDIFNRLHSVYEKIIMAG